MRRPAATAPAAAVLLGATEDWSNASNACTTLQLAVTTDPDDDLQNAVTHGMGQPAGGRAMADGAPAGRGAPLGLMVGLAGIGVARRRARAPRRASA